MNKLYQLLFILMMVPISSNAITRGDIKVIESAEDIRYLSQKIVKEYLYIYKNPKKKEVKIQLIFSLEKLSEDLRAIATTTRDKDAKDILEFLAYSKNQIEALITQKPDKEKAALMLDYSETLLEGANSIAKAHAYEFSKEEQMLMVTKEIEYLLERITKYYMAFGVGFYTDTGRKQMEESMIQLEANLEKINAYHYPYDIEKIQKKLRKYWKINKYFFQKYDTLFIPSLLFSSIEILEKIVLDVALYHSKNQ